MKELVVRSGASDFDGLITVTFLDEKTGEKTRIEQLDVLKELDDIQSTLAEDEQSGTKFLQALRRYISSIHGVQVSLWSALDYYNALNNLTKDANESFTNVLGSSDSTGSIPSDGQSTESESSPTSSNESGLKNP